MILNFFSYYYLSFLKNINKQSTYSPLITSFYSTSSKTISFTVNVSSGFKDANTSLCFVASAAVENIITFVISSSTYVPFEANIVKYLIPLFSTVFTTTYI